MITCSYDGLQRLTSAVESPATRYDYGYDLAGNRTGVWVNGTRTVSQTFDAANQVIGWHYDRAGNLLQDGTNTYTYDALGRLLSVTASGQQRTHTYNGDGVLVGETTYYGTTRYVQDLVSPLSQVLKRVQGSTTTRYVYGTQRLLAESVATCTWYVTDALGSVRQTLSDAGAPLSALHDDPWGHPGPPRLPSFPLVADAPHGASNAS